MTKPANRTHVLDIVVVPPEPGRPLRVTHQNLRMSMPQTQTNGEVQRVSRSSRTELRRIAGGKQFTPEEYPDVVAEAISELLAAAA
jgi:hypothetical protein